MIHRILIVDDEKAQVNSIKKVIDATMPEIYVDIAFEEKEILRKISDTYFNVAIVDLRMDSFSVNGFDIIKEIIEINPFVKIIVCSAYLAEYGDELNNLIKSGQITAVLDKVKFDIFSEKILATLREIFIEFDSSLQITQQSLEYLYSQAKNETDNYMKGKKFEYFVTSLFSQM